MLYERATGIFLKAPKELKYYKMYPKALLNISYFNLL